MNNPNDYGDIDIDVLDRKHVLSIFSHVPASKIKSKEIIPHNSGIYVQDIPIDPVTGWSSIDFNEAENLGYIKIDVLNNSAYSNFSSNEQIEKLSKREPNWEMLLDKEIVKKLPHISNHYHLVKKLNPKSIEQLAMLLAIIRPGKAYLADKTWKDIEKEVWEKDNKGYAFKRSHAFAYSLLIVTKLNLLAEKLR